MVGGGLGDRVDAGALKRPQHPLLIAVMPPDQVRRDPVQPRPGIRPGRVVTATLPECRQKRLGDDVLRQVGAEPARDVPAKPGGVPPEQRGEQLWFITRSPDHL